VEIFFAPFAKKYYPALDNRQGGTGACCICRFFIAYVTRYIFMYSVCCF